MNAITYMVIGWLIGEFFHLTIWEYLKEKFKFDNKKLKTIFIFLSIALVISLIASGFYRVTTQENIVLTSLSGKKIVKDNVGIGYSILSSRQKIDLRKKTINYPLNELQTTTTLVTTDNQVIEIAGVLEYQIIDVEKYAIKNKNTEEKLYKLMVSKIIEKIKSSEYNWLVLHKKEVEQQILNELDTENYGIKKLNFYFLIIGDNIAVRNAKSESEAMKLKAQSEKEINEMLKEILDNYDDNQLDYLKVKMLSEKGNVKWVLPNSANIMIGTENP